LKTIILPILLVAAGSSFGQAGAVFTAAGNNMANQAAQFSLANNPAAGPAYKKSLSTWGRNQFTGTSLIHGGIAAHAVQNHTALGLQLSYSGTPNYNQNQLLLACAQKINEQLSLGFAAGVSRISQGMGYPDKNTARIKLGMSTRLHTRLSAAMVVTDPWMKKDEWGTHFPGADVSVAYLLNHSTAIHPQFSVQVGGNSIFGMAVSHNLNQKLEFIGALQSGPIPVSAGLSFLYKQIHVSLASSFNQHLGFTPVFSLLWHSE
jgi:hypothetical protein